MDKHYIKDLKKAYRILRNEKRNYKKKKDVRRIEIIEKMKVLKQKILKESGANVEVDVQKQALIDKICEFRRLNGETKINMNKFSYSDLEFHFMKITGKVKTKDEYNKLKGVATGSQDIAHSPIEAGIQRIKRRM